MEFATLFERLHVNLDPRTEKWFLIDRPWTIISTLAAYIVFVFYIGPQVMKNRNPFILKNFIISYNAFQVFATTYLFYMLIECGTFSVNLLGCENPNYAADDRAITMAIALWYNIFLKFAELIETVIFILRKSFRQVSHLHVYHHVTSVLFTWATVRYSAGGTSAKVTSFNLFIHIIMYSYYLVSAITTDSVRRKLVFIKKIITSCQMVQFVLMAWISGQAATLESCSSFRIIAYFFFPHVIYLFYLFGRFFKSTYKKEI